MPLYEVFIFVSGSTKIGFHALMFKNIIFHKFYIVAASFVPVCQ